MYNHQGKYTKIVCFGNLYCQIHQKINRSRKRAVLSQFLEDIYQHSKYNYQFVDLIKRKIRWYLLDLDDIPWTNSSNSKLYDDFLKTYFMQVWEEKHGSQLTYQPAKLRYPKKNNIYGPRHPWDTKLWSQWQSEYC